jgi:PAS domain-containing protein
VNGNVAGRATSGDAGFPSAPDARGGRPTGARQGSGARQASSARPAARSVATAEADVLTSLVLADDLPDGLVLADEAGRVAVFNRAAVRLTGIAAADAIGRDVREVLPLRDIDEQCWWTLMRPYGGLSTRTRHPERSLHLPDGPELLVTVG